MSCASHPITSSSLGPSPAVFPSRIAFLSASLFRIINRILALSCNIHVQRVLSFVSFPSLLLTHWLSGYSSPNRCPLSYSSLGRTIGISYRGGPLDLGVMRTRGRCLRFGHTLCIRVSIFLSLFLRVITCPVPPLYRIAGSYYTIQDCQSACTLTPRSSGPKQN